MEGGFGKNITDIIIAINSYSDFEEAQEKARKYLDNDVILFSSPRKDKKYRIFHKTFESVIVFGFPIIYKKTTFLSFRSYKKF